ncbi:MAG: autotransporter assembly complex family protein [Gammaproteobacteria bacterium]
MNESNFSIASDSVPRKSVCRWALTGIWPVARLFILLLLLSAGAGSVAHGASVEVVVEGVEDALLENVRNTLSIEQYRDDANLTRPWVRRLHNQAVTEIQTALKPYGYYRSTVEKELLTTSAGWKVTYRISPGPPLLVKSADIQLAGEGQQDPAFQKLMAKESITAGVPLNQVNYDKLKSGLQKLALERGYFVAKFLQHEIRLDLEAYYADVVLHFDTGPRYQFGPVTFQPNPLSPDFLARYVTFKQGDAYSTGALLSLQEALNGSDYFSSVDVKPQEDKAEGLQVPVAVSVVPHKRNKYSLGVGYGTDTGARVSAGWERRRVNQWGHRITTDLRLSEIKNSLDAAYLIPLKNPRTEKLAFSAGYLDSNTDSSESRTTLLGVSRTGLRRGLNETIGLTFQREDYSIGDEDDTATLLMPEASWLWVRADNRVYSTRGMRMQFSVRGASEHLVSTTSFIQTRLQAKLIQQVFGASRIILRGDAGVSFVPDFQELPASLRYFAGGDQSVRGYDYESLGPEDDNGDVIGGKNLLVGSAEYEQHIKGKWSAAVFVDVGNAIDDLSDELKTGAGIGIRWRSPIGLIRVDVASALSESGNPLRLHLVIGPDL